MHNVVVDDAATPRQEPHSLIARPPRALSQRLQATPIRAHLAHHKPKTTLFINTVFPTFAFGQNMTMLVVDAG